MKKRRLAWIDLKNGPPSRDSFLVEKKKYYEVYQNIDYSLITKEDLTIMDTVNDFFEECVMKRDFLR